MIREAIETIFGPVANLECEEAELLRGPEPHHTADAIIAALQNVAAISRERREVKEIIAAQVQSVCDWDDRTSPDDHPDHLLITLEELTEILENVVDLAASRIRSCLLAGSEAETCDRCQGNGEIVTDWERYRHPHDGDVGDEAVAECPDCNGEGYRAARSCLLDKPEAVEEVRAWEYRDVEGNWHLCRDLEHKQAIEDENWRLAKVRTVFRPLYASISVAAQSVRRDAFEEAAEIEEKVVAGQDQELLTYAALWIAAAIRQRAEEKP